MKEKELERLTNLKELEKDLHQKGFKNICGIDEAGRGPLAGPVVIASVIMPEDSMIEGVNDSKKVSEKKRELLYDKILEEAISYSVAIIGQDVIDEINILNATKMAMREAVANLDPKPNFALVDAVYIEDLGIEQQGFVKGDAKSMSIAAASIVAKVKRDTFMEEMDEKYPEYGFKSNKGYGTKAHMDALREYGPCPIHRLSFLKFLNEE